MHIGRQHVILVKFQVIYHHGNIRLSNRPKTALFLFSFTIVVNIIFKAFLISQIKCPSQKHYYTGAIFPFYYQTRHFSMREPSVAKRIDTLIFVLYLFVLRVAEKFER